MNQCLGPDRSGVGHDAIVWSGISWNFVSMCCDCKADSDNYISG